MKYILLFLLCFSICDLRSQDCEVCDGEDVQITSNLTNGVEPLIYSWICTNGFTSSDESPLVPNVTSNITCTLDVIDALGCTFTDAITIDLLTSPSVALVVEDCNILFKEDEVATETCTTFEIEFEDSPGVWIVVSTVVPYTATEDGNYRLVYACECGDVLSNVVVVVNCTTCTPFDVVDFGDCDLTTIGTEPPCGSNFEVWGNINASQTCGPDTPPCDESTMTFIAMANSGYYVVPSDGCYQYRCSASGVDYCSTVVCMSDDCEVGCNENIIFTFPQTPTPCEPHSAITWPCGGIGDWTISESGATVSSGTNNPPSNFTYTYDGTYIYTFDCGDGCIYSNTQVVSGCGTPPCSPEPTISVIDNDCTLTALVNNCDGVAVFSWSTGASTESIVATVDGTYTVTVTGCCTSPLIDSITVFCADPCDGFSSSIVGLTELCDGDTETYTANIVGGNPTFTYSWLLNGTQVSTTNAYVYTHAGVTDNLVLQITDSEGCISISSIFIVSGEGCCSPSVFLQLGTSGVNTDVFCDSLQFNSVVFSDAGCDCLDTDITLNYDYAIYINDVEVSSGSSSDVFVVNGAFGVNSFTVPFDLCTASVGDTIGFEYLITSTDSSCDITGQINNYFLNTTVVTEDDLCLCGCNASVTDISFLSGGYIIDPSPCSTADISLLDNDPESLFILESNQDATFSIENLNGTVAIASFTSNTVEIDKFSLGSYNCDAFTRQYRFNVTATACGVDYTEEVIIRLEF